VSHTIHPIEDLKHHSYCKWHNSHSHVTNDCNVFRRQIQLAINESQLCLKQIHVDNDLFLVNGIDLQGVKVLVRPNQVELTKGKNVIIGEERSKSYEDKIWSRKVVLEKDANGKNVLKITVKTSGLGGKPATRSKTRALFSRKHRANQSSV
jgi:hypothetical protein